MLLVDPTNDVRLMVGVVGALLELLLAFDPIEPTDPIGRNAPSPPNNSGLIQRT